MSTLAKQDQREDVVRVSQSALIGLAHAARSLPLKSGSISARLSGNFVSAFKGRGMEFDEVRPYQPGDDIRAIDWRVTARTGKTHTKLFREERERPVLLWVDLRKAMFFGSRHCFKSVLAARAAALLAWSAVQHGDRLGGLIFSEDVHQELRPQRGRAATLHFIKQLAQHPAWDDFAAATPDRASGSQALNRLRRVVRPGSLIFLISDFRHLDDSAGSCLAQMARHNDIVMLFVNDPLETELPPAGFYRVSDGKHELGLNTGNKSTRESYRKRFREHEQKLRSLCLKLGMYFLDISTDQPLVGRLKKGLGLNK